MRKQAQRNSVLTNRTQDSKPEPVYPSLLCLHPAPPLPLYWWGDTRGYVFNLFPEVKRIPTEMVVQSPASLFHFILYTTICLKQTSRLLSGVPLCLQNRVGSPNSVIHDPAPTHLFQPTCSSSGLTPFSNAVFLLL